MGAHPSKIAKGGVGSVASVLFPVSPYFDKEKLKVTVVATTAGLPF